MSVIKTVVKYFATRYLTKDDLPELLARTQAERTADTVAFLKRDAALLSPTDANYKATVGAAEDLLIAHNRASSWFHLCRQVVRRSTPRSYYTMAVIGQQIEAYNIDKLGVGDTYQAGGEAGKLLDAIQTELDAAKGIRNPISRRSIIRNAIKTQLPDLSSDSLALLVELVQNV